MGTPKKSEVIKAWLEQRFPPIRATNLFYENQVLYSYGYHHPLAVLAKTRDYKPAVILNSTTISHTTACHATDVWSEAGARHIKMIHVEYGALNRAIFGSRSFGTADELRGAVVLNDVTLHIEGMTSLSQCIRWAIDHHRLDNPPQDRMSGKCEHGVVYYPIDQLCSEWDCHPTFSRAFGMRTFYPYDTNCSIFKLARGETITVFDGDVLVLNPRQAKIARAVDGSLASMVKLRNSMKPRELLKHEEQYGTSFRIGAWFLAPAKLTRKQMEGMTYNYAIKSDDTKSNLSLLASYGVRIDGKDYVAGKTALRGATMANCSHYAGGSKKEAYRVFPVKVPRVSC